MAEELAAQMDTKATKETAKIREQRIFSTGKLKHAWSTKSAKWPEQIVLQSCVAEINKKIEEKISVDIEDKNDAVGHAKFTALNGWKETQRTFLPFWRHQKPRLLYQKFHCFKMTPDKCGATRMMDHPIGTNHH